MGWTPQCRLIDETTAAQVRLAMLAIRKTTDTEKSHNLGKIVVDMHNAEARWWHTHLRDRNRKESIARPLTEELEARGLRVWFDNQEILIGDGIRQKIEEGLAQSRYGVVILSKPFISKFWTNFELDGLIERVDTRQLLLPTCCLIGKCYRDFCSFNCRSLAWCHRG